MKNYEDMSDFEINCQVAKANNWTSKSFVHEIHSGKWNPCQNPDDAWLIIFKHEIDVIQNNGQDCALATNSAVMMFRGDDVFICQHENPLRAAMIVFLKMNEDKL